MRSKFDDEGTPPNIADVVAEVTDAFRGNFRRFGPVLAGALVLAILVNSFHKVGPGEQGVVRRFGKQHRTEAPGLHYNIPLVEAYDVVNIEEVRRVEVGFRGDTTINEEALMLTGDENIVEVHMVVQYRVADPTRFLFRLRRPDDSLRVAAEVALRTVIGRMDIASAMTTGRGDVQVATRELLQELMDDYESGLEVTGVKLDDVDAPDEVKDAFNAVTRAREDKERLVNQARGYQEDKVPRARGEVRTVVRAAEAFREERVLQAQGDADRFLAVLEEYKKARDVTRKRLYIETMQRVLARVKNKVIVDERVVSGSLPVLPLRGGGLGAVAKSVAGKGR